MGLRGSDWRMPAEWEEHEATWLAWPHEKSDWPGKFEPIHWVYGEFVRYVSHCERVVMLCRDAAATKRARQVLRMSGARMEAVEFRVRPTNRSWARDYCPMFVWGPDDRLAIVDWLFNGWAKYPNWELDNEVPAWASLKLGIARVPTDIVLEGGAIDVNGHGSVLTTEECLLGKVQARNPGMTRRQWERALKRHLGVTNVLWLGRGIVGDDTHGHVDDLARFVNPTTVVAAVEDDPNDDNYEPLRDNLERLERMRDQDGRPFEVVRLPMPRPVWFDGQRLPASYANFYIANRFVLVPTFNDPADRYALRVLASVFLDRTVVGIHCRDLVLGLGTLHCMTQQQPGYRKSIGEIPGA